ncbi:MAG: chlorophyll synthesis pathway protein BchC [Chloroherpetonaceae bacterium]|nr:chlorophyll synthesis pathway protein BchC [Chloroherpetonaceae bacterium]
MRTKAVVFTGPNQIEIQDVGLREMTDEDVLVRTVWSSVSAGTEKMLLSGKLPTMQMTQFPVIPGYETVGKIIGRGDHVPEELLGKYVYVSGSFGYVGVNAAFGGASHNLVSPAHKVTLLDSLENPMLGILLPLASTALHIIDLAAVRNKRILILGQGAVGLLVAEFARLFGASFIAATDLNAARLEKSAAHLRINLTETGSADVLMATPFDAVIDCTGSMNAIAESLRYLKMNAAVILGGYYEKIDLPYNMAFMKELRFLVAKQWAMGDLDRALDVMAKREIGFEKIITHQKSVWTDIAHSYDAAFHDSSCLKLVLEWEAD